MSARFSYVKKGYDPAEVDSYIETLEQAVKEYKEIDAAIKNAIVNAQIAADNIIENANREADKIKANTIRQLSDISNSISSQRQLLDEFKEDYNILIRHYVKDFNDIKLEKIYGKVDQLESYLNGLKTEHVTEEKHHND